MNAEPELLAAREAIRNLAGWVIELDREPGPATEYVVDADAQAATVRALQGRRQRRSAPSGGGTDEG